MTLRIVREPPPNYQEVLAVFPAAAKPGTYFCFGRAIFVPVGNANVSAWLMAHEEIHAQRQGGDPAGWWRRYLDDPAFRLAEELPAHQAEFHYFDGKPRRERMFYLRQAATRLSSKLYGNLVTPHKAKQLITGRLNPDDL